MHATAAAFAPPAELIGIIVECRDEIQEILLDKKEHFVGGAPPALKSYVLTQLMSSLSQRFLDGMFEGLGLRPYKSAVWGAHTYPQWQIGSTLLLLRSLQPAKVSCPTSGLKYSADRIGLEAQAISSAQVPLLGEVDSVMIAGFDIAVVGGDRPMDPPRRLDIDAVVLGSPLTFRDNRAVEWAYGSGLIEKGGALFNVTEPARRGRPTRIL